MNLRQPMHPFVQSTLIMVTSGIVASLICVKAYGATLPVEEPVAPTPIAATAPAPAPTLTSDAQAAAQLRALLMGQRQLLGTSTMPRAAGSPHRRSDRNLPSPTGQQRRPFRAPLAIWQTPRPPCDRETGAAG